MEISVPMPDGDGVTSLYRALFVAYPDALLLVDASGTIVLSNPEASRLLGYAPEELHGLPVDALVPDAIRPKHAAFRSAYGHRPKPRAMGTQMDLVARRRDGSEVMVEIALSPLFDQGLPFVVAAVRGIGAYPRVKQALQRARYSECLAQVGRAAVDSRDTAALVRQLTQAAADALQVDGAVTALLEPNALEFRIASGAGLFSGPDTVGLRLPNEPGTALGFFFAQGRPQTVADVRLEVRFQPPRHWLDKGVISTLAVPISDRGRIIGVLAVHACRPTAFGDDEVHFLESLGNLLATSLQRAQSEEDLNHAQRLESVGQLTGGIAHDFNNLLTVIQGNNQVLAEHAPLAHDAYAQQLLAAADRATRRAAELTGKLLAFSRRQVLSPVRVDVGAMIVSLADMLQRTIEQHIRIEIDVAQAAPCLADPVQLESSLLNLAINARDAMPQGGTLSFRCRVLERLGPELAQELGADAGSSEGKRSAYIAIEVADTGMGMPAAVRERAFEPFFTTKELGRGTGLGLSTVYGFVKQSRGALRLDSSPGAGTTLTIVLPRFADAVAAAPGAAARPALLTRGLKVALVEDDAEVRKLVRGFLQTLGCEVTEFAQAEALIRQLNQLGSHALLLSDVALGAGMRGSELARQVQAALPGIAVLLMSGYSPDVLQSEEAQADPAASLPLLRKPFDREQLAAAMTRALALRR